MTRAERLRAADNRCDRQREILAVSFHRSQLDKAIAINDFVPAYRLNVEIAEQRLSRCQECECAGCAAALSVNDREEASRG